MLHIALHFIAPLAVAVMAYGLMLKATMGNTAALRQAAIYWLIMCATMIVDSDHLLANPIYDAQRCSLGFHPLHQDYLIALYGLVAVLVFSRKARLAYLGWAGIGLCMHMFLDGMDCYSRQGFFFHQT